MKKRILIILIIIISLSIGVFLGVNLEKGKIDNNNDINNSSNKEEVNNNDKEIRGKVEEIVSNELDQLLSKKTLSELTNQDKLQTILELYAKENSYPETISKEALENIFKNSSLRNLEIEYNDIYWDHMLQDTNEKYYEIEGDTYKKTISGHGANQLNTIYKQVTDYKKDENKISVSYKYAFYTVIGDGPQPINLYYTFEEALHSENKVITYDPRNYLTDEDLSGYQSAFNAAKNHDFSKSLDKLDTYTYTFEIINNEIVLVDFNRE